MSRSGYSDDYDEDGRGDLWRGAVRSAINGKRGQAMLHDLLAALDAMPEKVLAAESFVTEDGEFCALGVLGAARGLDVAAIDPEDWDAVAKAFGVASSAVREIVFMNDEALGNWETPAERWKRMRAWVAEHLR